MADNELIESLRRNSAQMGKLTTALQGLTEALRLQGEGSLALAAAIAKVAEAEPSAETGQQGSDGQQAGTGTHRFQYMDERPGEQG